MTLKEVNDEISRLRVLQRELQQEEWDKQKEQARKFVGRCYKDSRGTFLKIISTPIETWDAFRTAYDSYKFPALFLKRPEPLKESYYKTDINLDEFLPCYCNTVFLNYNDNFIDLFNKEYKEISQAEFAAEFDKCVAYYKELTKI